jgi:hypothetical protein
MFTAQHHYSGDVLNTCGNRGQETLDLTPEITDKKDTKNPLIFEDNRKSKKNINDIDSLVK